LIDVTEFNPNRLEIARKRRGLTKVALADLARISARMLAEYLGGAYEPPDETLRRFAAALDFPPEFFYGSDFDEPAFEGASFRSLSTLSARQRDQAFGSATFAMSLARWIEKNYTLPAPSLPRLSQHGPEGAAEMLRHQWGLGERPVRNMVHLLEAHGVRVFSLVEECADVDAFSFWDNAVPYVFLNTWKSSEHSRMDAAHELGHLVLHRGVEYAHSRETEQEARTFGSAFLMPRGSVLADAPRHPQLTHIVTAKHRWNVSVAALAYRMHKLGLLSDWQYRMLAIEIQELGYRREEPESGIREASQVLDQVLRLSRDRGMPIATIAERLNIPLAEINKVMFGLVLTPLRGGGPSSSNGRSPAEIRRIQ
jgi:Zn-dependent peptidase ImmA (M78 family)